MRGAPRVLRVASRRVRGVPAEKLESWNPHDPQPRREGRFPVLRFPLSPPSRPGSAVRLHCPRHGGRRLTDTPAERGAESTWARLRRRKVVQWGLAYVAGAWALVQVISHAVTTFHWPEQIQQIATLLLLIGLPVAVVLAWYHGDRGEQRIRGTELAILSLLLLVGGGLLWRYQNASETPPSGASTTSEAAAKATPATAAPDGKSIAVLPFVNLSSDAEQEYFSDGIAEQVLDLLSGVSGLRVIARTSSFSFKGKNADVSEIAQRLNVSHVLQGSVRRAGNRVSRRAAHQVLG